MVTTRVTLVLARRADSSRAAFEEAIGAAAAQLRGAGFAPVGGVAVEPDPFEGTAHRAEVVAGIDGVLAADIAMPPSPEQLAAVYRGAVERLAAAADPDRSAVVSGVQHTVLDGDGSYFVSFALRRPPAMSRGDFSHYWLGVHGKMARDAPRRRPGGYRQLHADPEASRALAAAVGFGVSDYDGVVMSDHSEVERMKRAFSHPAVREVALADERTFIDHSRSAIGLMRKL